MKETFHYDDATDTATIQTVQDVEPILKANKKAFNSAGAYKSEVFNKKASIPNVIWMQWCKEKGIKPQEFFSNTEVLKRFLNDPENKFCLTRPGKV